MFTMQEYDGPNCEDGTETSASTVSLPAAQSYNDHGRYAHYDFAVCTQLGDTMSVFPVFQAFWIELSSIGGTVFYKTDVQKGVTIGSALLLVGICFLVQHGRIAYLQAKKQRRASTEPGLSA